MGDFKRVIGSDGRRYTLFFKASSCFSNFYSCDHLIIDGISFLCTEQYYAFRKAVLFQDDWAAKEILRCTSPVDMKRIGREVQNFDQSKWNSVSIDVMATAVMHKFVQDEIMRKDLLRSTGSTLVECNPNDRIWGNGLSIDHDDAAEPSLWRGKNLLGAILTKVREYLRTSPMYRKEVEELQLNESLSNF